jgi:hypothetical protein
MDHTSTRSEVTYCFVGQIERLVLWAYAKRGFEVILNNVCKILPRDDLDAEEGRRIQSLIDAIDRAELIRRTFNTGDGSKIDGVVQGK